MLLVIIPLTIGWFLIIWAALSWPGEITPILMLPSLPMVVWTVIHINGYAVFQDDRDQLDTVLDMFSYPARWERLNDPGCYNILEQIPDVVEVYENRSCDMHVKIQVGKKLVRYELNRAYRAKFWRKIELLQDWREHQALIKHFEKLEK